MLTKKVSPILCASALALILSGCWHDRGKVKFHLPAEVPSKLCIVLSSPEDAAPPPRERQCLLLLDEGERYSTDINGLKYVLAHEERSRTYIENLEAMIDGCSDALGN